jgi:hypothetical protein
MNKPFLQSRLRTVVAVVIVVALIMYLNSYGRRNVDGHEDFGWPFKVRFVYDWVQIDHRTTQMARVGIDWSDKNIYLNLLAWGFLIALTILICWNTRKR